VKTTSREVHLYRWGPLYDHVNDANKAQPSLWDVPVSIHDDRVGQFVHRVKEECWQPWTPQSGCMEGLGVYAATDAVSTRGYGGGGEWCLIQFRMPAGTRYLDVKSMDGSPSWIHGNPSGWRGYCVTLIQTAQLTKRRKSSCSKRQGSRRYSTVTTRVHSGVCPTVEQTARSCLWTTGRSILALLLCSHSNSPTMSLGICTRTACLFKRCSRSVPLHSFVGRICHGRTCATIRLRRISGAGPRTICSTEHGPLLHESSGVKGTAGTARPHHRLRFTICPSFGPCPSSAAPAKLTSLHSSGGHDTRDPALQALADSFVALAAGVRKGTLANNAQAPPLLCCCEPENRFSLCDDMSPHARYVPAYVFQESNLYSAE
jgi:hypothetical protein